MAAILAIANVLPPRTFISREPPPYYGWQTDAWLHGLLHLRFDPPAAMLALPDPWSTGNAPYYTRDLSLYDGHYYFYNGPAPILSFIAPFRLLTGFFPTDALSSIVFLLVAVAATYALVSEWRQREAADAPAGLTMLATAMAAAGSGSAVWIAEIGSVQLSSISGAAWQAVMLWSGARAVHTAHPTRWLALSSLAYGLSVASRPSLLFAGFALFPLAWATLAGRGPAERIGERRGILIATVLPAAAIGLGLAWLNAARFGSPFEFGQRFFLSHLGDMRDFPQFSTRWLTGNLRAALTRTPSLDTTPPFVSVGWREPVGLLLLPWLYGALVACWNARPRWRDRTTEAALAIVAIANAAPLLFFFVHWSRYWIDPLVPLAVLASLGWLRAGSSAPLRWRRTVTIVAAIAALCQCLLLSAVFLETLW